MTIVRRNRDEDPEMEEAAPWSGGVLLRLSVGSTQSGYDGFGPSMVGRTQVFGLFFF